MIMSSFNGEEILSENFDNEQEFSNIDLTQYSIKFLVEGANQSELESICLWASSVVQNTVVVVNDTELADSYFRDPIEFIQEIREEWDHVDTTKPAFQVNSTEDIMKLEIIQEVDYH